MISGCVLPSSPVLKPPFSQAVLNFTQNLDCQASSVHGNLNRSLNFHCCLKSSSRKFTPFCGINLIFKRGSRWPVTNDSQCALRNISISPKAVKDVPYSFSYLAMTKKPKWWWRSLACLPYLMPLHKTFMYVETAYHLHPFLEYFENPFLGAIRRLPGWFFMVYFFVAYLGIVRKKEWPHYFRFHVVMGMLLENALHVIGIVSHWTPLGVYWVM